MAHSHLPVQHLIRQVEIYRSKRRQGVRPDWLTRFVDDAADLFEPLSEVARVGFDCHLADDRWVVGLYLGSIEIVGGPEDGLAHVPGFEFDVLRLIGQFSEVERIRWNAPQKESEAEGGPSAEGSLLAIDGRVGEHPLRVQVYSQPPQIAGPGLRRYPDGRCDPV